MKIKLLVLFIVMALGATDAVRAAEPDYAVVVSRATAQDAGWAKVVAALQAKHHAAVVTVTNVFGRECRDRLRQLQPRYVAFVARPQEVGVEFVRQAHLLSREMDGDPYDDFMWGIITAATPEAALRIAQISRPLVVRRALSTTGINLDPLDAGLVLSDGRAGDFSLKENGQVVHGTKTNDTVSAHERYLNFYNHHDVDLLVSSSHATEANLEMPFSDGSIVISGAHMFMVDRAGLRSFVRTASCTGDGGLWYQSPEGAARRAAWAQTNTAPELRHAMNPKIYIAAGNCLIGDAMNTTDSLVMDWLTYQGVDQFVGYTVPTWFGRGGWGTLELWQDYGGQNDLAEAFFLNNQRIIYKLVTDFPAAAKLEPDAKTLAQMAGEAGGEPTPTLRELRAILKNTPADQRETLMGYLYDRDVVAFYGDPKWDARLDQSRAETPVKWHWSGGQGSWTLTVNCLKDFKKDELIVLLPERIENAAVTTDTGVATVLNDEFVLLLKPDFTAGKTYQFEIKPL